jgi:hypothetical protein
VSYPRRRLPAPWRVEQILGGYVVKFLGGFAMSVDHHLAEGFYGV